MAIMICRECQQKIVDDDINSVDGWLYCSSCLSKMGTTNRTTKLQIISDSDDIQEITAKRKRLYRNSLILFVILLVCAWINGSGIMTGVVMDTFTAGCFFAAVIYFILAVRVKKK